MYTVYSLNNCMYCDKAKEYLRSRDINFVEIAYVKGRDTDQIMELVEKTGCSTFPQIFMHDEFIGGYDALISMEEDEVRFDEYF